MIWFVIYFAGVVAGLILHGIYGSWQDDAMGVFNALIWPVFIPIALLLLPMKIARFVAEGRLASAMSAFGQDRETGLEAKPASAVPKADARKEGELRGDR